jgi:hypothetical protein
MTPSGQQPAGITLEAAGIYAGSRLRGTPEQQAEAERIEA